MAPPLSLTKERPHEPLLSTPQSLASVGSVPLHPFAWTERGLRHRAPQPLSIPRCRPFVTASGTGTTCFLSRSAVELRPLSVQHAISVFLNLVLARLRSPLCAEARSGRRIVAAFPRSDAATGLVSGRWRTPPPVEAAALTRPELAVHLGAWSLYGCVCRWCDWLGQDQGGHLAGNEATLRIPGSRSRAKTVGHRIGGERRPLPSSSDHPQ